MPKRSKDRRKKKLNSTIQVSTSTIADEATKSMIVQEKKSEELVESVVQGMLSMENSS